MILRTTIAWLCACSIAYAQAIPNLPPVNPLSGADLVIVDQSVTPSSSSPSGRMTGRSTLSQLQSYFTFHNVVCGSLGPSTGDDTASLQAAINAAVASASTLFLLQTNYNISAPLQITGDVLPGFGIEGCGTFITQNANNVPILLFNGANQRGMIIDNMVLDYATPQSTSNTGAVTVFFAAGTSLSNNLVYNSRFTNLRIGGGFKGMSQGPSYSSFWGNRVENIGFRGSISGNAIDLSEYFGASPNNYFGNVYVDATAITTGPVLQLGAMDELTLDNIEINNLNLGGTSSVIPYFFTNSRSVYARNIRVEQGTFNANFGAVVSFSGVAGMRVDGLEVTSITFNPSSAAFLVRDSSGGTGTPWVANNIFISNVAGNNKLYGGSATTNPGTMQPVFNVSGSSTGYVQDIYPFNSPANSVAVIPAFPISYSVAGTPLPACASYSRGIRATVLDATTPSYLGSYVGGGAVYAGVICGASGWVTD